jgi:hypothetical protein
MLELTRKGRDVYHGTKKLTMVEQASKGPNNEVIKIEGLEGANGAKWISLSKLQEGLNQLNTKGRDVVATQTYTLNMVEKAEVDRLQAEINKIKDAARARYAATPRFKPVGEMNAQELEKYIEYLTALKTE